MRIAILTTDNRDHHRRYELPDPYFGPAIEAVLQGLANRPELEIHVVSCTQRPMQSPSKLADNVWFHSLHVPNIGWLKTGYQGCVRAIRKKLRDIRPDIVHGQGTERECALSAIFSGFPNVLTIHGNIREIARLTRTPLASYWWWTAMLERFSLPRTGGVFCNSKHTEALVKPLACKTWFVPNAIRRAFFEMPRDATKTRDCPVLLNIGTIAPLKRQLELLELAQQLYDEGYSFEIHFIGPANPTAKYAALFLERIREAEQNGFARYLGELRLSELIAAFDSAGALIHVPFEEAFGLVAAEALARNLKFFGTNVGGLPDIAEAIEGADLFPLSDIEAMKRGIINWLRNGCARPPGASKEMKRRYHPDVIAKRHEQIYHEILTTR